jgi:hypothetical protein
LLSSIATVLLPNNIMPMTAPSRPGKSALDEFLPELNVRFDTRDAHIDPHEIQLESVAPLPPTTTGAVRAATDKSAVQWWPMFAAALVGIGVSMLAFGAWARFGQF